MNAGPGGPQAAAALAAIDWSRPWFHTWREPGARMAQAVADGAAVHQALQAEVARAGGLLAPSAADALQFVPAGDKPAGLPYETYIEQTHRCPTRDGLHDFFNGLCWLKLPQTKRAINAIQADAIARQGVGGARGAVRDAATVLDENGALLHAPEALWQALQARQWQRLFVDLRPLWAEARLTVFGHALLEKLVQPRKNLTAHVWCVPCPRLQTGELDAWLAASVQPERLAGKPFAPLPVLGVPGWWPENQNFSFYDDSLVFRDRRP